MDSRNPNPAPDLTVRRVLRRLARLTLEPTHGLEAQSSALLSFDELRAETRSDLPMEIHRPADREYFQDAKYPAPPPFRGRCGFRRRPVQLQQFELDLGAGIAILIQGLFDFERVHDFLR